MRLKRPGLLLALLIVAYGVYAAGFIYQTSALVEQNSYIPETRRYFVLFDDAMVSMRYAKNLAAGHGLVWNPGGERVEGYTNPLWVAYMALFHLDALNIPPAQTSLYIQISAALLLAANLWVVWKIAGLVTPNPWVGLGAAAFSAFYLPLNVWGLQGTEVSVLTLVVSLATWRALAGLQAGRFAPLPYALLGLSTGVRMDMAVPLLALAGFMFFADAPRRWRHLGAGALSLGVCLGPQIALRLWYYDEWLPNTYYLKMAGYPLVLRVLHGLDVTLRFFIKAGPLPLLIFVFRRDRAVRLLAWMFLGQVLYSMYVGGDAWEEYGGANRYLSIAIPLWFILLTGTLGELYRVLAAAGEQVACANSPLRFNRDAARLGLAACGAFLFITSNATYGPGALSEWLLLKPSLYAAENGQKVQQARLLDALTTEQATVALAGAGIVPYFSDRAFVDMLGKNDKVIAHLPMDRTVIPELKPGHMKWNYAYSIGQLQPDVVLELWVRPQDAGPYLDAGYVPVWFGPKNANVFMRQDSPHIFWDRLQ